MAPVRTRKIALVSNRVPPLKTKKRFGWSPYDGGVSGGGGGGGGIGGIQITLTGSHTVLEGSPADSLVGTLSTLPAGATLELIDDAGGRFVLDGENLVTGAVATDYEAAASHLIVLRAVAGATATDQTFTIEVLNVVELQALALSPLTVIEGATPGTLIGTFVSTPPGASLSLLNDAFGRYAISGNTLVVGNTPIDYESTTDSETHSDVISVVATLDGEELFEDFSIQVTDVVELVSFSLTPHAVDENSAAGVYVGTLISVPAGAAFTLNSDAGGRFVLDGDDIKTGSVSTDYETATSHVISVTAARGGEDMTQNVTVDVTNVNEGGDITLSAATIAENSVAGTVVGALSSTLTSPTYTLAPSNGAGTRFAISGNNLVAGVTATNYETATSHVVTIRATSGADFIDKAFTVTVTDVDEITDITLSAATIAENSAAATVVGTLTSTPPGATWAIQSQTPAGTYFAVSGNSLVAGATPTNFEANTTHSVTVRGTIGGETFDKAFTITVTDVDEISAINLSANSIAENSAAGTVVGALTSTPAGATYTIQAQTPSGTYFAISGGNLVAGATATNFEANQSHSVTVRGTRLGETFDQVFTVNVTNVNEMTGVALSANSIAENSAAATVVGALTSTPPGATFTIQSQTPAGTYFALSGNNLVAGATPTNFEVNPSHSVTVRATIGTDFIDQAFTVNVTDVDEISNIALSFPIIPENSAAGTVVGALTSTPPGAVFTLAPGNTAGTLFAISGGNLVAGATATNYETAVSHDVTVRGTIGSEVFDKVFTITVSDVDEINGINLSANTVAENTAAGQTVGALTSTPTGAVFTIQSQTPAGTYFAISGGNLVTGATPTDFETNTSHSVTVRGTIGGETFDQVFTINVTNVNELTNITLSAATIAENAAAGTVVGNLASVIAGASFAVTAQTPSGTYFTVNGSNQLVAGATGTNFEANTSHLVTVTATRGTDTFSKDFTITVTDVDEISAIALSANSLAENSASGTVVGALTSTPTGATYAIQSQTPSGTYFAISGGNLVAGATPTDFEANASHSVTVRGTRLGEIFDQVFTVNITDVDEISAINLSANSVGENTGAGVTVGALTSTPAGAVFTILSQTPNNTYFAISGNNLVTGATPTDYETNTSHSVTVRGTRLGETFDQVFTINVVNADEITTISVSPSTINELNVGQSTGQVIGTLSSTPGGATFSLPAGWSSTMTITGGNVLNKANNAITPFPYMPTFPDYDAGRAKMPIIATLGPDTHQQDVLLTINPGSGHVLTLNVASQDVVAGTSTSLSLGSATGGSIGAPYGYGWFFWGDAGTFFDISNANGNPCTVSLKTGLTGTYSGYVILSVTNSNSEFGYTWIKVTLTR